ncbi:LysM peptidoglycan-binding domain-containing protein [Dactylosporangium sp. NBC_01737]|uniref:peptidoglycan-binding protein n=1 Tax=Dactylosporangium sp. NBC_01737 TaxID=2975959 RepID=UPI002E1290E5|nr:LysM peptidoglycan-binding domain-containing protein [Dactylosporangium sp. NBC_01737]
MPHNITRKRRRGHHVRRILAGLAALAAIAAFIVVVPLVLLAAWRFLGPPLPSVHDLTGPDDGTVFVRTLCLVGWLAWALFTWSVFAEVMAQWRGWQIPVWGWQRRTAASLVTAVTMMFSSPAVAATAAPVATPPAIVSALPAAVDNGVVDSTTIAGNLETASRYVDHVVQPGEQMPTLAERYLGDRYRWRSIAEATYGLPQPGGQVLKPGDTRVYPGWTVRIPTSTAAPIAMVPVASSISTTPRALPVYDVRQGDWLWYIAERFLGDPERNTEIAALNPDLITESSGARGPDHIEGGWRLTLPADARDRGPIAHATGTLTVPPPAPQPGDPGTASGGSGSDPSTTTSPPVTAPSTTASPSASATVAPSASASASPATSARPSTATTTAEPGSAPASTGQPVVSAPTADAAEPEYTDDAGLFDTVLRIGAPLIGAALLATLTLRALGRRRHRQQQHRPVGRRLPEPASPTTETHMRVVAEPAAVDRLDHALRALAAQLANRTTDQMPDIVGAWLHGTTVNLLLTSPNADAPHPWISDGLSWSLSGDAPLPDCDGQLAPLPVLVAVGSRPGMHLLLDLERLGLVTITGDPAASGNLLRYLAAELALNSWSDHVDVHIAGFDGDETGELLALSSDRLTAAPSISAAIERIRRRAGQVVQSLDHLDAGDPMAGRIADVAADAWMPQVLLISQPKPDDVTALEALDSDLAAIGRCAVAVAVASSGPIGRWPVAVDAGGALSLAFLGMDGEDGVSAAQLPRAELSPLADLLTTARRGVPATGQSDLDGEAAEEWASVPPAPETDPWAHGTDAAGALIDPDSGTAPEHDDEVDPADDDAPEPDDPASSQSSDEERRAQSPASDADTTTSAAETSVFEPSSVAGRPAVVALVGPPPARKRVTAAVRAHRHHDPVLDADLRAWTDADPTRPRIAILGPVTVEAPGHLPDERLRFYAEIITYLAVRGQHGVTTDQFDDAIWPEQQVKANTRRVAVARARRWLGETPDGDPWLPDATADRRYRLRDGYLLDWTLFRRLRSRGESRGPAGIGDLRNALALVRGAPLAGADIAYSSVARNPFVWLPTSEIQPHHLAAAIVDTSHRLVELSLDGGDIPGARWAVEQAWLADPERANDIAWRDLLRVAAAEGNFAELDHLLEELMTARDAEIPEDLDKETYRLLCDVMPERMRAGVR